MNPSILATVILCLICFSKSVLAVCSDPNAAATCADIAPSGVLSSCANGEACPAALQCLDVKFTDPAGSSMTGRYCACASSGIANSLFMGSQTDPGANCGSGLTMSDKKAYYSCLLDTNEFCLNNDDCAASCKSNKCSF